MARATGSAQQVQATALPGNSTMLVRPGFLPGEYRLDWRDEFDGASLDRSKWNYDWEGVREGAYQSPSCVSVKDSCLVLETKRLVSVEGAVSWAAGAVTTLGLYQPTFGYFEARIKIPRHSGPNFWGAFWTWSRSLMSPDGEGAEYDVMESFAAKQGKIHQAAHWGGYEEAHRQIYKQSLVERVYEWHDYGMWWREDAVQFFIDGRVSFYDPGFRVSKTADQFMRLSCHLRSGAALPTASDRMLVDWVRVWRIP